MLSQAEGGAGLGRPEDPVEAGSVGGVKVEKVDGSSRAVRVEERTPIHQVTRTLKFVIVTAFTKKS
jgi:hypothetical protein